VTDRSTHAIRWGITLTVLWAIAVLFAFTPPQASAHERSALVVVLEKAGAGTRPEQSVEGLGGRVVREIPLVRGFSARVPRSAVRALRGARGIKSVNPDRAFHLRSTTDAAPATASTTLDILRSTVGATDATGGADVALVDSGVAPVGSLDGRVVNGPDFSEDGDVDALRHLDAFGHGTHLAGIIAAVAPQSSIVNVKVADREGSTSLARILAGLDWVVRRGDRGGNDVRVLNLAFGAEPGRSYRDDPLAYAVERAWQQGIVVVTSAGNGGPDADGLDSPAYDPYVVAVGAADTGATASTADDAVAPFSSRGSDTRAPDVVAPGVAVVSTRVPGSFLDEAFPAARIDGGFRGSGTSQAAAAVSGAAALLIGRRPALEPDEVKALLRSGAHRLPGADTSLQGAGLIDVSASQALPVPRRVEQRFPLARLGGWWRSAPRVQYAVENLRSSRWSSSRWSSSRWSSSRWSSSRWSSSRWSGFGWGDTPTP
jgi:subtilisin family serine protease